MNYLEYFKNTFGISDNPTALVVPEPPELQSRSAISKCLKRMGFKVYRKYSIPRHVKPDIIVYWNKYRFEDLYEYATSNNIARLEMERGFINREDYAQIDHKGFMCESSWANDITKDPPIDGKDRLAKLNLKMPNIEKRDNGYILLLGQLDNDTQMIHSEIKTVKELAETIIEVQRTIFPLRFRRPASLRLHPLYEGDGESKQVSPPHDDFQRLKMASVNSNLLNVPITTGTLQEDLRGAKFAISINSNSLNDALMNGVPCMCFGPHLGNIAGVIKKTSKETIKDDIIDLNGWTPDRFKVQNYFEWLAARQWNNEEISDPSIMFPLINKAFFERRTIS